MKLVFEYSFTIEIAIFFKKYKPIFLEEYLRSMKGMYVDIFNDFICAYLVKNTTTKQHDHISFYLIYLKGYLFKVTFSP